MSGESTQKIFAVSPSAKRVLTSGPLLPLPPSTESDLLPDFTGSLLQLPRSFLKNAQRCLLDCPLPCEIETSLHPESLPPPICFVFLVLLSSDTRCVLVYLCTPVFTYRNGNSNRTGVSFSARGIPRVEDSVFHTVSPKKVTVE